MEPIRFFGKSLSLWIRELHLYLGLLISPFVLLFAVSTLLLNHTLKPWGEPAIERTEISVAIPENLGSGVEGLEAARQILHQTGLSGEIDFVQYRPAQKRLIIPVMKPGKEITIDVNLETQTASIEQRRTGIWAALLYLHKSPGPHNAALRGNWTITRIWGWTVDTVVFLLLFITVSGLYLWAILKAERNVGLILLGAGVLSFVLIVAAIIVRF